MPSVISRRSFLAGAGAALAAGAGQKFALGLEIYSLRGEAEKDLPGTITTIRKFGFSELEVGELYGRSAVEFRRLLDDNGLKVTSMMAEYKRLTDNISSVADDAHALGARYVVCSTVPHKKHLTAEECHRAAESLNRFGENLATSGLRCCYHIHGIEFDSSPEGTRFDLLAKLTSFAHFEMDIFWVVYANQDPVKLLERYPGRFPLMHVKDMRADTVRGGSPGDVQEEASVPLGAGVVDISAALRAAQAAGVRHYYLEDEAVNAMEQIPKSLRYLDSLHL